MTTERDDILELLIGQIKDLSEKVDKLGDKVDELSATWNQSKGALGLLRWMIGLVLGGGAFWAWLTHWGGK